ncbi:MAG TPA: iron ABC transporter permease [Thermomicrobiaceae bacterium]|nr:iron ABC transporter permease [Thermomicrobiaceae bacterium]
MTVAQRPTEPDDVVEQRGRPTRERPPVLLALPALLVALLALTPVGYLFLRGGASFGRLLHELDSPSTGTLVLHTLLLTVSVTLACVVLGVALAVLVARTDLPARRLWTVLFALPLGIPAFITSYTWVAAGYQFLPRSTFIYGLRGAVIVLSLAVYPYVYLPVVAALHGLDPAQEETARALGSGPLAAFARVTLPQLRTAIAGGALLIALHMLAEFGALQLLRYQTLTTAIVQRVTVLSAPEAARTLSLVLAAGSLALLAGDRLLRGRPAPVRLGGGAARAPAPWRLGAAKPLWVLVCIGFLALALGVPLFAMLTGLARALTQPGAIDWAELGAASASTARYALATAMVATIAALPVSLLAVRHPGWLATLTERSTWIAHSLPGVVVALALVYLAARWLFPLYQTSALLVAGYVVLFLPIAVGAQQVGLVQAAPRYDQVARSLGLGPLATFFRVTLPLALPGIAAGAMLVLLNAGKELTMTLLLHPTGTHTLATALWATTNGEVLDFSAAAPYAVALVVITAIPAYLLIRHTLQPQRGSV